MPLSPDQTLAGVVEPCAVISAQTTCADVDRAFRTIWACPSVVVRDPEGRIGLVARTTLLATMAGRRGYGRSSWGRRPVSALATWGVPTVTAATTVAQAAALLADGVDGYPDLPVIGPNGEPVGIVRPVQVMRALADQSALRAAFDDLTGVASRVGFVAGLRELLDSLAPAPGAVVVAYVDLDRLKPVNDLFGHSVGDALLRSTARRLAGRLQDGDLLGRLGGDEFAVVRRLASPGAIATEQAALELGEELRAALAEHDPTLPALAGSTASVGLAVATSSATSVDGLLQTADEAMYEAKLTGGDQVRLGSPTAEDRQTVSTDDLLLAYQPVIDVRTGRVTAVEALLRVRRPDGSLQFPVERMRTAARTGGTLALDRWVLATACRDMARWQADLGDAAPPRLHVNLAPETTRSTRLASQMLQCIDGTGLEHQLVCLELSEHAGVDDLARATGQLRALAAAGVTFALDDMGATLGALRLLGGALPVSCVKIDRSVVEGSGLGLAFDTEMLGLVRRLGEQFGVDVVAEGVETAVEDEAVRGTGIHQIQGFRHARPLLEADLLPFLLAAPPRTPARSDPGSPWSGVHDRSTPSTAL